MLFSNLPAFGILTLHADDDNGASTAIGGTAAGGGGGDLVPDEDVMQPRGPERLIAYAHRAAVTLRHGIRCGIAVNAGCTECCCVPSAATSAWCFVFAFAW